MGKWRPQPMEAWSPQAMSLAGTTPFTPLLPKGELGYSLIHAATHTSGAFQLIATSLSA